jgi:phosphatidylinositol-3-phosphatase
MRFRTISPRHFCAWSCAVACVIASQATFVAGQDRINSVFVIAMENHNWTQPVSDTSAPHQIFNNLNAPFINSIVDPYFNGGALNPQATLFGTGGPISINSQVSYATAYHNVLATPSGTNPDIHPSEPNYIWSEAGTNFSIFNDSNPYNSNGTPLNSQSSAAHLATYLHNAGYSSKSYQEDIDTDNAGNVLPQSQWVSPITNRSGTYTTVANQYNGSKQYNYAVKHNPPAFFTDTNGGFDTSSNNQAAKYYAPLQQLQTDLNNNTVAQYNWISPNQFNDMHTALSGGYKGLTGDNAQIKQGDDFLAVIVPKIMASQAYKNNGAIIIWNDETEGTNENDFSHTIMEIVISPLAKGYGYASSLNFSHSSDLKTMQEIFQAGPLLGDAAAAGTNDLSDLFVPNTIPVTVSVAGDYNHNGIVDAADYATWRTGYGGVYSQVHYDTWRANFGQSAYSGTGTGSAAGAAVPEPSIVTMLLLVTLTIFFVGRPPAGASEY